MGTLRGTVFPISVKPQCTLMWARPRALWYRCRVVLAVPGERGRVGVGGMKLLIVIFFNITEGCGTSVVPTT